jgi:ABC-type multidrug transport system ATPase subunit
MLVRRIGDGPVEWDVSTSPEESGRHGFFRVMDEGDSVAVPGHRFRITSRGIVEESGLRTLPTMALEGRNLTIVNGHGSVAYSDISIRAESGELTCLVGPSGSGKSTLIKAMLGIEGFRLSRNRLLIRHGNSATPVGLPDVSYVAQELDLYPELSVSDQIRSHASVFASAGSGRETIAEAMRLARFPAERLPRTYGGSMTSGQRLYVRSLSGGEKKRLALGLALLRPSVKVLALDEVTSGLDAGGDALIMDTLRDIVRRDGYIGLIVTHTLSNLAPADWVVPILMNRRALVPRTLHPPLRFEDLYSHFGVGHGPDAPRLLMGALDSTDIHRCDDGILT